MSAEATLDVLSEPPEATLHPEHHSADRFAAHPSSERSSGGTKGPTETVRRAMVAARNT